MDEFPKGSVEIPWSFGCKYEKMEFDARIIYMAKQLIKDKSFPNLKEAFRFINSIRPDDVTSMRDLDEEADWYGCVYNVRCILRTAFLNKASGASSPDSRLSALDTRMNNIDIALEKHPKFEWLALEIDDLKREVCELKRARVEVDPKGK